MADPEVIGHYRLLSPIAEGSMGRIYLVEHEVTQRKLALKLLKPELFSGERARQRFLLEARAAGIEHPNLIQVTDAGEDEGQLYIVMRYVRGADLRERLQRGPQDPAWVVAILAQVAAALDASHAAGMIHRDVKPSNILITSDEDPEGPDHAFLCDFGITKDADGPALTQTGYAPGTRAYMAPEQFRGQGVAGTSDQYALACVAFEALAGRRPFEANTEETLMYKHLSEDPPTASSVNAGLSAEVDAVLAKGMAKDPAQRYPTCVAFTDALREAVEAIPEPAAPNDLSETPTVVPTPPPANAELANGAAPATSRRSARGPLIGVAVMVAVVVVAVGVTLALRSGATDSADKATPSPAPTLSPNVVNPEIITPSPVPPPTPTPTQTATPSPAEARLRGPYRLALDYTGSRGLTGAGSPFWNSWPMDMKPVCAQGPCSVRIAYRDFGITATGTLARVGDTYRGSLSTFGLTTCNGRDSYGTLRVLLRVNDGIQEGATWRASDLSGRMVYTSRQGACVPATWTATVTGASR